jgi:Flp pilus assembly protein TadD
MRRFVNTTTLIFLSVVIAATAMAQVRGRGRLQGLIVDETGKPIAGATVTLVPAREETQPIVAKTDAKGRWSALGLTGGTWNIDIAAEGFETSRGTVAVSEFQMSPAIKTTLVRVVVQQMPVEAVPATPIIPQEAIDAIKEGQDLLKIQAGDVVTTTESTSHTVTANEVKDNAKQAVARFEKALPLVPTDNPDVSEIRNQLLQVMSQAYYRAGDLPKAISMLEQANIVDATATPGTAVTQRNVLLVNLYLENGDLAKARALLEKLPAGAITDPTVYSNIGILFLNKNNPTDAMTYFTKAVELDPKRADSYYYRGLAALQLGKNNNAKADFEQVIALAPDSSEAGDAKQYLASLKK